MAGGGGGGGGGEGDIAPRGMVQDHVFDAGGGSYSSAVFSPSCMFFYDGFISRVATFFFSFFADDFIPFDDF